MVPKTRRLATALMVIGIGFGIGTRAEADLAITTPAGLQPGDQFRIIFVTDSTTEGTSSSIAYYNNFVAADAQAEAGGGNVTYNGTVLTWSAIASTDTVSAITNIGTTGAPVYLSNGTEVASSDTTSTGGLWSGTLMNAPDTDLLGNVTINPFTAYSWTGTEYNGNSLGFDQGALGDTTPEEGFNYSTASDWVNGGIQHNYDLSPLYGISQVLTVSGASPTPEPSTFGMAAAGIGAAMAYGWNRRRKRPGDASE